MRGHLHLGEASSGVYCAMADGALHIEIGSDLSDRLKAAAGSAGLSEAAFVRALLEQQLLDPVDYDFGEIDLDPAIDDQIADETERQGDGLSLGEFSARLNRFGRP